MTSNSRSGDAVPGRSVYEMPTLWGVVRAHKRISAAVLAALVVIVGLAVAAAVASSHAKPTALTDASTCSQWSSAGRATQTAYSRRYIGEHADAGFLTVAGVTSAIHADCVTAAYLGESDDVSIVAAIKHAF
jgi:hypothetical protein